MADFNIRSESVDVEQIMKQIRARIREKRGVDYTEEQIRELASVRLETFLDPKNLRSDLLEQFRRSRPALPSEPARVEAPYEFNDQTLFETHRGALRFIRKVLNPILKMFFNPNPLINVLHTQAQFNVDLLKREQRRKIEFDRSRAEWNALYYEVLHNLVLETTRSGIEIKNLKMRVEALASRLDFSERRVRALEGVVQYRPEAVRRADRDQRASSPDAVGGDAAGGSEEYAPPGSSAQAGQPGEGAKRRRRRRRGRRGSALPAFGGGAVQQGEPNENAPFEGADGSSADIAVPPEADTGEEQRSKDDEQTTYYEEPRTTGEGQMAQDSEAEPAPAATSVPSPETSSDDDLQ